MSYSRYKSLTSVAEEFNLNVKQKTVFEKIPTFTISEWLKETLELTKDFPIISEKARSELIVTPILIELKRFNKNSNLTIYSGQKLDIDKKHSLNGECDFILARSGILDMIEAPIISIVEAKKNDLDLGIGQCIAQMIGAYQFNKQKNSNIKAIFGCITTGLEWKFLKLEKESFITIDTKIYYLNELEKILGIFQSIIDT